MNEISNITGKGPATMTTREIALLVDKEHKHVMRDARTMLQALELGEQGYAQTWTDPQNGQGYVQLALPRDLTMTLVTGYSIPLRKKVIDRLDELERRPTQPAIPQSYADALRLAADQAETIGQQAMAISSMQPAVDFYSSFADADGLFTLQNTGRVVTGRPNKFIQSLKVDYLFYQGRDLVPYARWKPMGLFEVKVVGEGTEQRHMQTFVTPKGLQHFAKKFGSSEAVNAGNTNSTDLIGGVSPLH